MKKILFLLNNMNIGGTEKSFLNLLGTLSPEEYDVTLLLLEATGGFMEYIPSWVHVETVPGYLEMKPEIMNPPISVVKQYFREHKVWRAVRLLGGHLFYKLTGDRTPYFRIVEKGKARIQEDYDVTIAYAGPFDFLTVYVLYDIRAKEKIQWIHFDVSKFHFNTKMCRRLYPRFDQINVVSDEARKALLEKIPEIAPKTKTVLNIVSAKQCRTLADIGHGFEDEYTPPPYTHRYSRSLIKRERTGYHSGSGRLSKKSQHSVQMVSGGRWHTQTRNRTEMCRVWGKRRGSILRHDAKSVPVSEAGRSIRPDIGSRGLLHYAGRGQGVWLIYHFNRMRGSPRAVGRCCQLSCGTKRSAGNLRCDARGNQANEWNCVIV